MSGVAEETITRVSVPALDAILGKKFKVLDDGFIRVVDYMGGDASIVQAARVSYGAGTTKVSDDNHLIRYLMRHRHTTPFEMCEIKLHVRVPMDHWRQWIRHRTANVNEYSTRYSEAIDARQCTPPDQWRLQSAANKQGSGGVLDANTEGWHLTADEKELHEHATAVYDRRLKAGVAREQARKDLPLSTYTEAYWKCDLHNVLHFLSLRMDAHAQKEIRDYAKIFGSIVSQWCPMTWGAFVDYRLTSMQLSYRDLRVITMLNSVGVAGFSVSPREMAMNAARDFGWLERKENGDLKSNRERQEFEAKAKQLNIQVPW